MKEKFYQFKFGGSNRDIRLTNKNLNFDSYVQLARGELNDFHAPLIFTQKSGKNWKDILCPSIGFYIISDRVKNALDENNITGYKTFPIIIYDKKGNEVPGYHGFSITGRSGEIDWTKSQIITKHKENKYTKESADAMKAIYPNWEIPPPKDYKYYKGLYPGLEQWDGSDIFKNKNTNYVFLSQKAYEVLKNEKIKIVRFTNLAEYETWIETIIKN